VWNHFNSPAFNEMELEAQHTLGLGVRPFGNDRLTLAAEIAMMKETTRDNVPFKLGGDFKLTDGLHLRGSWADERTGKGEFTFGLGFDLPHSGVALDNARTEDENIGSRVTFTATQFRQPSAVSGAKKIAEVKLENSYPDYDVPPPSLGGITFGKGRRGWQSVIRDLDRIAESPEIAGLLLHLKNFPRAIPFSAWAATCKSSARRSNVCAPPASRWWRISTPMIPAALCRRSRILCRQFRRQNHARRACRHRPIRHSFSIHQISLHRQKAGIDVRTYTAGKYKSSLNPISDSLSAVKIEELDGLVDETYEGMLKQIAEGRGVTMTQTLRDTLSNLLFPNGAKELRLMDEIGWNEDAKKLAAQMAFGDKNRQRLVNVANLKNWDTSWQRQPGVAVIGVYGDIVSGESQAPGGLPLPFFSQGRSTGSATVVKQIEAAIKDRYAKAVVLRVDSPGGSAVASDEIARKIREVRQKKPVVVSMGDLAASGGYYVSTYGDRIFANPLTMTGSIGVITVIPFIYDLARWADFYVRNFDRGKYSPLLDIYQPPSAELESWINRALNFYYEPFLQKVADGRKLDMIHVREIAQGRVWTGQRAKEIKLIDEFGGLHEALEYARKKVGLPENYAVQFYPVPPASIFNGLGVALFEN
jgi:signal peptide peptidase SppA